MLCVCSLLCCSFHCSYWKIRFSPTYGTIPFLLPPGCLRPYKRAASITPAALFFMKKAVQFRTACSIWFCCGRDKSGPYNRRKCFWPSRRHDATVRIVPLRIACSFRLCPVTGLFDGCQKLLLDVEGT